MIESELMNYKNYYGSVSFNYEEKLFYGKIEFIRDLINYEADDTDKLIQSFHEAVDDYLEDCKSVNKNPDTFFLRKRISPDLT